MTKTLINNLKLTFIAFFTGGEKKGHGDGGFYRNSEGLTCEVHARAPQ